MAARRGTRSAYASRVRGRAGQGACGGPHDLVLSAEIIVITLGTVAGRQLATQIGVTIGIAAPMKVGVYGLVAGIVRLDDIGLYLL